MQKPIFAQFHRRRGVRNPAQLIKPNTWDISTLVFPKESVLVYTDPDYMNVAPLANEYLLRDYDTKIFIEHMLELQPVLGKATMNGLKPASLTRQWQVRNKRFRLSHDIGLQAGPMDCGYVLNTAMLGQTHRYPKSIFASYYKWYNVQATIFAKLQTSLPTTGKQYFLMVKLPQQLPSLGRVQAMMDRFNEQFISKMPTQEHWMFLELMKWLSVKGRSGDHASLFSLFTPDVLSKINLVFQYGQRCFMANLGVLDYYVGQGASKQEKEEFAPGYNFAIEPPFKDIAKGKIEPIKAMRYFLRASMMLQAQAAGTEAIEDDDEFTSDDEGHDRNGDAPSPVRAPAPTQSQDVSEAMDSADELESMLANLDADLDALEEIEKQTDSDEALSRSAGNAEDEADPVEMAEHTDEELDEIAKERKEQADPDANQALPSKTQELGGTDVDVDWRKFNKELSPIDTAKRKVDALADAGLIDAADYRKKTKAIGEYASLKVPGTNAYMGDFVKIPPESLVLNEANTHIPDIETVPDKSMLQSTLKTFDRQYISDVMDKDIMAAVDGIQKMGVIILGVDKEVVEDASGKYAIYSIRVMPVDGQPSTMRFKLPVVNEDGTWTAGGTRYALRAQRVDFYPVY